MGQPLGSSPGRVTMVDVTYGSDIRQDRGDQRTAHFVNLPVTGRRESLHRGSTFTVSPGTAAIFQPPGGLTVQRRTRGQTIVVRLDGRAVDDSLSDVLGYQLTSHIEVEPTMPTTSGAESNWTIEHAFHKQLSRPNGVPNNPMVAMPFRRESGARLVSSHRSPPPRPVYASTSALN